MEVKRNIVLAFTNKYKQFKCCFEKIHLTYYLTDCLSDRAVWRACSGQKRHIYTYGWQA